MTDAEELRPESKPDAIAKLIERIDAHDAEATAIAVESERLGMDGRKLKAIRAHQKTIAALMGIDAETAARVQS